MTHIHLDELDRIELDDGFEWRPVRRRFDIRAFGVNAYAPGATGQIVEEHSESTLGHEEIYLVLRDARASLSTRTNTRSAPASSSSSRIRRSAGQRSR